MATFIYDGKSSLTAAQTDTVVITADPTLFTQATQNLNDAVLRFGANSLTITGATLTSSSLSNVSLGGGTLSIGTAGSGVANTSASSLLISTDASNAGVYITGTTTADSKNAFFGGNGISSPNDGNSSIQIGGQGSFLVYGNGGDDLVRQGTSGTNGTAFDSTSAVTVFGGKGGDVVNLSTANNKGSLLILGGESTDSISVLNVGNTTIYGGLGAGDSTDGADSIALIGATGGTINVFGNGGDDIISGLLGDSATATTFTNNTVANVFGGAGADSINLGFASGAKGTLTVYGGESTDTIIVSNTGVTTIYGGTGQGDSTDGADNIVLTGSAGTVTVFGNAGNDIISGAAGTAGTVTQFADGVNAAIYGGRGNDSINVGYASGAKGTINVFGGEDQDSITVANTAGSATTVYGGLGQGDTADGADTITITGQGTATVFGNGGADVINLGGFVGASGAASVNVVTVYGGTGNDTINIGNTINNQVTYNLSGNEGVDTFVLGNTGVQEVQTVTFAALTNGASFTLAGVTVTATGNVSVADLATAFAGKAAGSSITGITNATTSGTLTDFSGGTANTGAGTVTLVSTTEANVATLTPTGSSAPVTPAVAETLPGVSSTSTGAGVSILDFAVGTDKLSIQNGVVGTTPAPTLTTVPAGGFADLQAALNAASSNATKGAIGVVAFGGSTYVVTNNDGQAGFVTTADSALKLTGITDVNGVANSITVL